MRFTVSIRRKSDSPIPITLFPRDMPEDQQPLVIVESIDVQQRASSQLHALILVIDSLDMDINEIRGGYRIHHHHSMTRCLREWQWQTSDVIITVRLDLDAESEDDDAVPASMRCEVVKSRDESDDYHDAQSDASRY